MSRGSPEQQIQRAVFEHLAVRAASTVFAFHPANGGWRSRVEGAILKGMGVRAGVPDIVAVKNGRCYALELKAPDGRLTPAQRDAHAALVAAGATVAVAYGLRARSAGGLGTGARLVPSFRWSRTSPVEGHAPGQGWPLVRFSSPYAGTLPPSLPALRPRR